jgi:excisionase family DNA binding protein
MDSSPVMTTQEVAVYLRVSTATVYRLARAGQIPATRVGRSWRFHRRLIDEWLCAGHRVPDDYPPDWDEIARQVKEAAGWRCEHCGSPHNPESGHVLTVHHLDGNPANSDPENLVALCQRCHLRWQNTWRPGQLVMDFARPQWMKKRGWGGDTYSNTT